MTTDTQGMRVRPGGVTFVVVLAYLVSIFTVIDGFFVTIGADELRNQLNAGASKNELLWAGIVMMAVGVIGVLLTGALARGSRVVRILFTIWIAFQIAGGLSAMISYQGEERLTGVVPFVLGIVVLYLLFNERAHDFFEKE
jgi:CHASE2 domain-containing sensor protein